jgi:prolyl-tRNA synthetase
LLAWLETVAVRSSCIVAAVQAFIPETGKGIQGATSHALGQNFSKMFSISYMDDDRQEQFVWQASWGCTTRTLGVMVMTHADNTGLVVPPRVAGKHAVIVPITMASQSDEAKATMHTKATELAEALTAVGVCAWHMHLCT